MSTSLRTLDKPAGELCYATRHCKFTSMPGKPLPDAERLFAALTEQMRPHVGPDCGVIGIHTGGVWIAERLHQALELKLPIGTLDVSFYRDDFRKIGLHHDVKPSDLPFEVDGRHIVLVDDVLYTGRTIRAAMNEIFDYGRPASIRLAALVDRGGRELPIAPQFLGAAIVLEARQSIELTRNEHGRFALELRQG